ncbi:hypothetical protein ACJMK2_031106 [Sinanodonta woodiana]|uniref:Translation initiation factor 3 N-terminal domain-containing protein n=1 Tax=Sinanodonta woodiana TaxID=1069815 RepID=A0ABD3WZ50_SINWO
MMRQAIVKNPLWIAYKHKRHMMPLVIPLLGCRFMFLGTSGRFLLDKIWRTQKITCKINHWQTFVTSENHLKRPISDEEVGEVLKPIKVALVQVFDPQGLFIGKMPITKARKFAEDRKMILFQMKSTVDDPKVNQKLPCFKMIASEDLLEERKKDKQSKSKEKSEKVFAIKDKINDHDLTVKVNKIKQELEDGYVVKITIKASPSEEQEENLMNKVFKKISDDTKDLALLAKAGTDLATEIKFILKRKEKQEKAVDA